MPLNLAKAYSYVPKVSGPVQLVTRSSRRARLTAGGTYFRSKEYGESANLIRVQVIENTSPEGALVVQHGALKPDEMIAWTGSNAGVEVELFENNLEWNQELRVTIEGSTTVANLYGIRWQIAGGEDFISAVGPVVSGIFSGAGVVMKLKFTTWPAGGVLTIRARVKKIPLTRITVTTDTGTEDGWAIPALRTAVNSDSNQWIYMPTRSGPVEPPALPAAGEDAQDTGTDAKFLTAFSLTNLAGGDGLPTSPAGLNTGPDRTLVHLNYAEKEDGSLGELNVVHEWVGDSQLIGSWQRYS
jgi:hypothetical protein